MRGRVLVITAFIMMLPALACGQGLSDSLYSLHNELEKLFEEMIPLCSRMIDIGRVVAGFAALWYIALRVWRHLARAEEIDFYPLLRPFAIGMAIMLFPHFINLMNGVLKPTVEATAAMAGDSNKAILYHILEREKNRLESPPTGGYPGSEGMEKYEEPQENSSFLSSLKYAFSFSFFKSIIQLMIRDFIELLYVAAGLCINLIRTFYLIVLVILGPLVLGLSVFDGFQYTLPSWIARYINIYMWLPVANIFGAITSKVLENMILLDQNFFSYSAYIVFMLISIVGYTTVPNVAGYIIQAGGRDTLLHKVNNMTRTAGKAAAVALI